jgi:hypothetical protein
MYAAIHNILHHDKPFIACRKSARTPKRGKSWTDESRLEWQANSIAPRILMPKEPFKVKAREFMARRGYSANAFNSAAALDAVIRDLAAFFAVSKQSVSIRLVEVGLISRAEQLSAAVVNCFSTTTSISLNDAFREYRENTDFRELMDSGAFRYVERHFVLNDNRYIAELYGRAALTNYARSHQRECCLTFTLRNVYPENGGMPKNAAYLRNGDKLRTEPHFESDNSVINAEEMRRLREKYKTEYGSFAVVTPTFSHFAVELMTKKHWNRAIFKELTLLDDSAYTRITQGKTERITARTVAAFCVGIGANQALAEKLFAAAGLSFNNSPERFAYCFLFGAMQGRGIDECNAFLESEGFEPLGVRQRAEPEIASYKQ